MNKPRGRPFEPGNSFGRGRPRGSRNKATLEAERLLEQYSAPLVRKCITQALQGDAQAMRLCMDRLVPVRRDRPVRMKLPKVATAADVLQAQQAVVRAVSSGDIAPPAAESVMRVLDDVRRGIETHELETRIDQLEEANEGREQHCDDFGG